MTVGEPCPVCGDPLCPADPDCVHEDQPNDADVGGGVKDSLSRREHQSAADVSGEGERWMVYVCPNCGHQALGLYAGPGVPCAECKQDEYAPIEVVPVSKVEWERKRVQRLESVMQAIADTPTGCLQDHSRVAESMLHSDEDER